MFVGVAAAFAVQVIIAVSVLSLAPRRVVEAIVAVLFLAGAVLMLRRGGHEPDDQDLSGDAPGPQHPAPSSRNGREGHAIAVLAPAGRTK